MIDRSLHPFATARRLRAGLLCLGLALAAGAAQGAETTTLVHSDAPQTLSGAGDRVLIVEGPFGLAWQSAGGRFSIQATAEGATAPPPGSGATVLLGPSGKPEAAAATEGKAEGRLKLRGEQRYRVSIVASGPWELTVTW